MNYSVDISISDEWNYDGSPVRVVIAEFADLEDALAYEIQHGGSIKRVFDGKCLAPDGRWV